MKPAILANCGYCPADSSNQENGETALAEWQTQLRRLRLLVEQADEFTPPAFVKKLDEFAPELRSEAMGTVIHVLNRR